MSDNYDIDTEIKKSIIEERVKERKTVNFEIYPNIEGDIIIFNIVFIDTGEIRQKRRSKEWVMKRIFQSELKTWKNKWGELLDLLEE